MRLRAPWQFLAAALLLASGCAVETIESDEEEIAEVASDSESLTSPAPAEPEEADLAADPLRTHDGHEKEQHLELPATQKLEPEPDPWHDDKGNSGSGSGSGNHD